MELSKFICEYSIFRTFGDQEKKNNTLNSNYIYLYKEIAHSQTYIN